MEVILVVILGNLHTLDHWLDSRNKQKCNKFIITFALQFVGRGNRDRGGQFDRRDNNNGRNFGNRRNDGGGRGGGGGGGGSGGGGGGGGGSSGSSNLR